MTNRFQRMMTTWIAAFAIMLHALIPFSQRTHYAKASGASEVLITAFCSAHAGQTVTLRISTGTPAPSHPDTTSPIKCPLCLAGAHFALTPDPQSAALQASALEHVRVAAQGSVAEPARRWHLPAPRGPPLS